MFRKKYHFLIIPVLMALIMSAGAFSLQVSAEEILEDAVQETETASVEAAEALPWTGAGTAASPYELTDADDLQALYDFVAAGGETSGMYFRMTADITLPPGWQPIGNSSDLRFRGSFDDAGHTLTVPPEGLPLLGYVQGAAVHDLKIYGERIAGYGLVNNYEGRNPFNGSAVTIDRVTLLSGSATLRSGLVGANITNIIYAGAAAGFTVTIRDCVIEEGVVIGYDRAQSQIGSIAGRVQGTVSNCVSYADVYGVDYVGGIAGTRDNAMGSCVIENCAFHGSVNAGGSFAGGILGGGYYHISAPNGVRTTVNGCFCDGSVVGADMVGGILGGDYYVAQAWNAYSFRNNSFTGSVTATAGEYIGGIIGFYDSLNRTDDIRGNYYSRYCGADRGIGFVQYVDTSCGTHETESGAVYFSTEENTNDCPYVQGCHWMTGYQRTDDPLGADADDLCYTDPETEVPEIGAELLIGQSAAVRNMTDLSALSGTVASWRSSRPEVVRAGSDGTLTAVSYGTAVIRGLDAEGKTLLMVNVQTRFTDVTDPEQFYYDPIYWAADLGITTGFADGTFRPLGSCNRASVVTFLWRLAGRPTYMEYESFFSDLTGNPDFDSAILWAADMGITTGWADGTFRPWITCNRAAIVTFLWRYAGREMPASAGTAPFSDMTGNGDFDNAILWAVENGITTGWADGTFRPWNTCNRLSVVAFLSRYAN